MAARGGRRNSKAKVPFAGGCQLLMKALLETLNFLQAEFLRFVFERGLHRRDLPGALAELAIPTIDSLKAALLLCYYDDFGNADGAFRRFEEFLTVMMYFVMVDDGTVLTRWFEEPLLVLREKKYKVRSLVAEKAKGYFTRNPQYDFKGNFDMISRGSVHPTWESTKTAFAHAAGRYALLNPGAEWRDQVAETVHQVRAVMFLGVLGPSASRFLEFLERSVFSIPGLANVSPGSEYLKSVDEQILRWAVEVQPLVERMREAATSPSS